MGARLKRNHSVSSDAASTTSVAEAAAGADLVITSYALLRLDFDAYQALALDSGWAGLILDEAQNVKNASARVHECARALEVPVTLAVTGTPMENHLGELWAIYNVLIPGLLGDLDGFNRIFRHPIEQRADSEQMKKLKARIRAFILRRGRDQPRGGGIAGILRA